MAADAMEAGIATHVWSLAEIVALFDAVEKKAAQNCRCVMTKDAKDYVLWNLRESAEELAKIISSVETDTDYHEVELNRTGFVGGLIQREDGAHGTTQQVFPGVT